MRTFILIFILSLSFSSLAQHRTTDSALWSWTRFEGEIDPDQAETLLGPLPYSMEIHYRLKDGINEFNQFLLRPMLGYKLDDTSTIWFGYAYIGQDRDGRYVGEHRLFQMITYSGRLGKTPVVFIGNTRIEQRILEDDFELNHRIRQTFRFSAELFKIQGGTFHLFFQDEVFFRLNQTKWAGKSGFDQNRLVIGIDFKTNIGNSPATISAGYMNNLTPTQVFHGVNVGAKITIPSNKKKRKPKKI
jgi:hypothetical protein